MSWTVGVGGRRGRSCHVGSSLGSHAVVGVGVVDAVGS